MAIQVHLDEKLKERHMTSKELCKLVDITEANLSVLRSGKAKGVRFSTINKICHYLKCDIGEILSCDGNLEEDEDEE
jgi:putative transcriptional regulator